MNEELDEKKRLMRGLINCLNKREKKNLKKGITSGTKFKKEVEKRVKKILKR